MKLYDAELSGEECYSVSKLILGLTGMLVMWLAVLVFVIAVM